MAPAPRIARAVAAVAALGQLLLLALTLILLGLGQPWLAGLVWAACLWALVTWGAGLLAGLNRPEGGRASRRIGNGPDLAGPAPGPPFADESRCPRCGCPDDQELNLTGIELRRWLDAGAGWGSPWPPRAAVPSPELLDEVADRWGVEPGAVEEVAARWVDDQGAAVLLTEPRLFPPLDPEES